MSYARVRRSLGAFRRTVLRDHHQDVPIRCVADIARTPVSYAQRIINENWTFNAKPRDPDSGHEAAPGNLFVFKYLILERRLSAWRGMDLWQFVAAHVNGRPHTRILSIGSGTCATEMEIAQQFRRPYVIDCMDLNADLIGWATEQARARGLNLRPVVADLNEAGFAEKYDLVMIVAALHHFIELEQVAAKINDALADDGLFVTYEPVMRSGMFLFPATRLFLGLLFLLLPARLRVNHQDYPGEKRVDRYYHEYDRSGWTFESIRSGDIPRVLRHSFETLHYGRGMTFLRRVSDTLYGPNYDLGTRRDRIITDILCWIDRLFRATRLLRPEGLFFVGRKPRRLGGNRVRPAPFLPQERTEMDVAGSVEVPQDAARRLAEQALREQAAGNDAAADRLFTEAQRIDPEAVAEILREHDAAHEPDSRDQRTADQDRPAQHAVTSPPRG